MSLMVGDTNLGHGSSNIGKGRLFYTKLIRNENLQANLVSANLANS